VRATVPSQKKVKKVEELKEKLAKSTLVVATDYTGMTVRDVTELRKLLRDKGIEFHVVKNTLSYIAGDGAGKQGLRQIVQGPTAIVVGGQDPVMVAKTLDGYVRSRQSKLSVRGALLDGQTLTPQQFSRLAMLPPKMVLLGNLLGEMKRPLAGLLAQLQAPVYRLAYILHFTPASLAYLLQRRAEQLKAQEAKAKG
jgi:large subunit ribosomal protein L10